MTFQLLVVVELVEVFLVFSQDSIFYDCRADRRQCSSSAGRWWKSSRFYTLDRVQQRFWSRSPSHQIQVEVFKIFHQSRVPQRLLRVLLDTLGKGFFGLPGTKKVQRSPGRWRKNASGRQHPRGRHMRFIMSCEMTSGYRS